MITTVCLNPAIDKSARVDRLRPQEVNRLQDIRTAIGGKGINVAVVLGQLEAEARCVAFVGDADERFFAEAMEARQILFREICVPGHVRTNLKIMEDATQAITEFNETGAAATAEAMELLTETLREEAKGGAFVALCGSLPPGCGADTYQKLMRAMPDARWVVDAAGDGMRQALAAGPFLIKPNLSELEDLTGRKLSTRQDILAAAASLCGAGAKYVAVSLGGEGALLTNGETAAFAPAIPVPVNNTVGAGDSMLAGMLFAMEKEKTAKEALRYGAAAGAACVSCGGAPAFSAEVFRVLLERATVKDL